MHHSRIMRRFLQAWLFKFPSLKRTKCSQLKGKDELLEEDNMIAQVLMKAKKNEDYKKPQNLENKPNYKNIKKQKRPNHSSSDARKVSLHNLRVKMTLNQEEMIKLHLSTNILGL